VVTRLNCYRHNLLGMGPPVRQLGRKAEPGDKGPHAPFKGKQDATWRLTPATFESSGAYR
jgi:hypothetical protein